jgi:hypothetical protein
VHPPENVRVRDAKGGTAGNQKVMQVTLTIDDLVDRDRCTARGRLTGIDVRGYRRHCVTAQGSW